MTPLRLTSRVAALLTTGLVLAGAGCGGSSDDTSSTPASTPTSASATPTSASATPTPTSSSAGASTSAAMIVIKDYAYSGATTVSPGATVSVRNDDSVAHTVTADSGSAFGITIPAGKTATFTAPSKAGTYAYHCDFHANMAGSLTVG